MRRHVILVGLPGSGKSTVGPLLATELGLPFVDLDRDIEQAAGRAVPEIFALEGESVFRELEREAMDLRLGGPPSVLAPGGGWAAQPGNLEVAGPRAVVVYLACSPGTAASRLAGDRSRPLLLGGDPAAALERLLLAREPYYRRATFEVDAEAGPPALVAAGIATAVTRHGS